MVRIAKGIARDALIWLILALIILFMLLVITGRIGEGINRIFELLKMRVG